ncbi:1,4-dihydroxy-6-naphthoate synthase [Paraflavitalea sp. CAU 1676]|uniref:1,4-dihydroxy-6-naphthoate synthase n=1 Tax=Paraflavitalea sp. CAU 1676 TaxID=3032598 RepID=UPI0023DB6C70|nr:1,4-dihydroxy-6-naphthoate synthase [Paraflavitalea sp. CAU 1676]MDF2192219.1 1,4-dihydroxy-6-naphthoate synthase [Paraflavitalea sp. CAU 1676]
MKLSIGFSPCPNDTFIFDALVNKKIDTGDVEVEVILEDVQTLNEWALQGKLDITKISYGVLPLVLKEYIVLPAGGALGKGVGPLLITQQNGITADAVYNSTIAIPGEHTTAHMLFSLAFPDAGKKQFTLFSKIEDAVIDATVDAGVIIHENRFTYQDKGLVKLMDLGEYWETQTGSPIPLGGIVMKRTLGTPLQQKVNTLIRASVEFAFANYPLITEYVKLHSQEMSESVMRQHIDLYVNNYSIDLGEEGRSAVGQFLDIYARLHNTTVSKDAVFL